MWMMERFNIFEILAGIFLCTGLSTPHGVPSESCTLAYDEGGAPAVFQSSDCAQWVLIAESLKASSGKNCQSTKLQGHREYQEDRIACNQDIAIPLFGKDELKEAKVDVYAVFDGHGGAEASEMAEKYLLDYFLVHLIASAFKKALAHKNESHSLVPRPNGTEHDHLNLASYDGSLPLIYDESLHEILREALLWAIRDIDRKFSLVAFKKNYYAGSTATVVLLLNGEEVLVANVGDSKALLCSGNSMTELHAEELTRDHHPDKDDERARIEAAGGFIRVSGVPRVNGILALSRAIGDVYLKRYGVTAEAEVTGWQSLSPKDHFLIIASDGVFESLTSGNCCNLIAEANVQEKEISKKSSKCSSSSSLADCIVKTALKAGSTDNLSAIVVPLRQAQQPELKDEL